jgi:hypothetical protein
MISNYPLEEFHCGYHTGISMLREWSLCGKPCADFPVRKLLSRIPAFVQFLQGKKIKKASIP